MQFSRALLLSSDRTMYHGAASVSVGFIQAITVQILLSNSGSTAEGDNLRAHGCLYRGAHGSKAAVLRCSRLLSCPKPGSALLFRIGLLIATAPPTEQSGYRSDCVTLSRAGAN